MRSKRVNVDDRCIVRTLRPVKRVAIHVSIQFAVELVVIISGNHTGRAAERGFLQHHDLVVVRLPARPLGHGKRVTPETTDVVLNLGEGFGCERATVVGPSRADLSPLLLWLNIARALARDPGQRLSC